MAENLAMVPDNLRPAGDAAVLVGSRSSGRFVTSLKLRYQARLAATALVALALLVSDASYAAQQTIDWFDEASCRYKIRFDPKKYDATRIKNTADFVFSGYLHDFPLSQSDHKRDDRGFDYRAVCARHARAIEALDLVDLPGIEDYRRLLLEQLQEWCDFGIALDRGTLGDTDALRSFEPAASYCSRYADALEGKIDLKQVWHDVIATLCQQNGKPEACRAEHLAAERQPNETERIKGDVLDYGWRSCAARRLKTSPDTSVGQRTDSLRRELDAKFKARFRITRAPCID